MLNFRAKLYIAAIVLAGVASTALAAPEAWYLLSWRFPPFLALAIASAAWKVRVPFANATMSVLSIVILFGIVQFTQAEVVGAFIAATLYQCVYRVEKRQTIVQILFNVSSAALSATATSELAHLQLFGFHLNTAPLFLLPAAAFFVFDTAPVVGIISILERKSFLEIWKSSYFWSLPFYVVGGSIACITSAFIRVAGWHTAILILPVVYIAYRTYHVSITRVEEQKRHAEEISALHFRTIECLAMAIEAKDETTANHLARVQTYAVEIGKELGMRDGELEALRAAALLHDIGKVAVPEYIISKPGKLTPEEFEKMKVHPIVGAELLERVNFPYAVTPIVRAHHERWNGAGYPDGLAGEEIPLGARILTAVDCFDALATDRQYRKALPVEKAISQIVSESGTSFDPRVVAVLERRYKDLEQLAKQNAVRNRALSVNAVVERGSAPAAGFQKAALDVVPISGENAICGLRSVCESLPRLQGPLGSHDWLLLMAVRLSRVIPHDAICVHRADGGSLVRELAFGECSRSFPQTVIRFGEGISGWVAEGRKSILNGNPGVEPGYTSETGFALQSALAIPLISGERLNGVLSLYRRQSESFSEQDLRSMESLSAAVAALLETPAQAITRQVA